MEKYIVDHTLSNIPLQKRYRLCGFPLGKKYRSHFEIIALMVEAVKDYGQAKFSIMKHASINCGQADKFLNTLTETGFIERYVMNGRPMYRANDRGLTFLKQYYALLNMFPISENETRQPAIMFPHIIRSE